MKKPLILHTWPWSKKVLSGLTGNAFQFRHVPYDDLKTHPALLKRADALLVLLSDRVNRELLSQLPNLKALGTYSVGMNHIDLDACRARGISVVNTPDVLTRATAELALALLLAAARRLPEGEALCRKGNFKGWTPDLLLGLELKGRHAVLLGEGRIGRETALLLSGVGLTTEFITRRDSIPDIKSKLARAQILSLHCPLTPETRHWLDQKRMRLLPRDCILINTARGEIVDESALIRALKDRRIFAAGLDVFEHEPKLPLGLRRLPNVVLAPHLGSATESTRNKMLEVLLDGLSRSLAKSS